MRLGYNYTIEYIYGENASPYCTPNPAAGDYAGGNGGSGIVIIRYKFQ